MKRSVIINWTMFSCLLILFSFGCEKQNTKYYIQDSFKQWVLFQKGSHWVYLNEKSQVLDCTFISKPPVTYMTPPEPASIQHEELIYSFTSGFLVNGYLESGRMKNIYFLGDFLSSSHALTAAMINNSSSKPFFDNCWLIERIDSLIINNVIFNDVIHTRDSNEIHADFCIKDYYFVKNIGLIKFSITTAEFDSTWSLVRWKVVQ